MASRYVSIWFRHLSTDWFTVRNPALRNATFVLSAPSHGKMMITATNAIAQMKGIHCGMALADARAIFPGIQSLDDQPDLPLTLLKRIAEWCIRFTPVAAIDPPDGIILDVTGCPHLWGGEMTYLTDMTKRLEDHGYQVQAAMADTIGAAWAIARFGTLDCIIAPGEHIQTLGSLPPAALRLETDTVLRMHKLGLRRISQFINMPGATLLRRFGQPFIRRLRQATGQITEQIDPVHPALPYHERLPCLEPIVTATGIEIALKRLLELLCNRLRQEEKGLREAVFKGYRMDGKTEQVRISVHRPSCNTHHLFKLFENNLRSIEPDNGIELFVLEAPKVEDHAASQEKLWEASGGFNDIRVSELIDRLTVKFGDGHVHRYVPDEHYWPERSFKPAATLHEALTTAWRTDKPRPIQLLPNPERIEVMAPVPDYPPMLFRYKGKLHKIKKADGPERIEQEWWLQQGQHRDYYHVEDDEGRRYWLFRRGHYDSAKTYQWFIHGFFA